MSTSAPPITTKISVPERDPDDLPSVPAGDATKIGVSHLNFYYGKAQALDDVSLQIQECIVMAFIGPSGCGKSTFLRTLNRMNDVIPGTRVEGEVLIDGRDIYAPGTDVAAAWAWSSRNRIHFRSRSSIMSPMACESIG